MTAPGQSGAILSPLKWRGVHNVLRAEEYRSETRDVGGIQIRMTSYRIGDVYHCHIENVDPGATIARAEASTRDDALRQALSKVEGRLMK